jgi:glycosyltransferase involved in cell wall biosynthesis
MPIICIVAPFPPPWGGMAIQADKVVSLLKNDGFRVISIKTNADFPKVISFISKIRGLRTLIRTFLFLINLCKVLPQVDVVYFLTGFFNFFFWVTYPGLILIKIFKKRVILSARGGEAASFFRKYRFLIKPVLKYVDAVSVPSHFLEEVFLDSFGMKTTVIPNIADLRQFKFREREPLRPRLIVTRSLEKGYNVARVIEAFKEVRDQFLDSTLGIVGDGSERSNLEVLVNDLGLRNHVTFYGVVPHGEIQDYYDQYDIFVNASNVDNFPGVILEAFSCGLPVVSTKAGGIPYLVEDGVTGLLVEKEDFKHLAKQIVHLLRNPEVALTLARNARNECYKYSWEGVRSTMYPLLKKASS